MFPFLLALLFILKIRLGVKSNIFRSHQETLRRGGKEIIQNI